MRDPHFVVYLPSTVDGYPFVHAEFLKVGSTRSLKGGSQEFLNAATRVACQEDLTPVLDVSGLAGVPHVGGCSVPLLPRLAMPGVDEGSVGSVFQALKVFVGGGPFLDLAGLSPDLVAADGRLTSSGALLGFVVPGGGSSLTCGRMDGGLFYAWLLLSALFPDPGVGWAREYAGYLNLFAPSVDRDGVSLGWCVAAGVALVDRGHSLGDVLADFQVFRRTVGGGRAARKDGGPERSRAA